LYIPFTGSPPQGEGENKNWFEEHKTELKVCCIPIMMFDLIQLSNIQVAGGLALGLGALGAAVMHHGHKKDEVIIEFKLLSGR